MKRLSSLLLVFALVMSLSLTAFAADAQSLFTFAVAPESAIRGETISVAVDAAAAVVTDGVLSVDYDEHTLRFQNAHVGDAWAEDADMTMQVNAGNIGNVTVAFAGLEAAQAGTVLTLDFAIVGEGQATIAINEEDSYITGYEGTIGADMTYAVSCPAAQFVDVDLDMWYHAGIDYVVHHGYMEGMGNGKFGPMVNTNRAMMVTVLYRMAGSPEAQAKVENPFKDVDEDEWYYDAIMWAVENGIAKGMTEDRFAPKMDMTREQMVTFMARYAQFLGVYEVAEFAMEQFVDVDSIRDYAVEAMNWAVANGLVNGMSSTLLLPQGSSVRAQVATILERFDALYIH